jgi:hypothetical protein
MPEALASDVPVNAIYHEVTSASSALPDTVQPARAATSPAWPTRLLISETMLYPLLLF